MTKRNLLDLLKASYMNQKEAQNHLKDNYTYDNELSTNKNKVFIDGNNKPHIVSRGSHTIRDWADNALIGIGLKKMTHGYKSLKRTSDRVASKYEQKANLYGHSQSGNFVENIPNKNIDTKQTLNKAIGLGDIGKKIQSNQKDYIVQNDLPSFLHVLQNNKNKKVLNPSEEIFGNNLVSKALENHRLDNLIK